jgi:Cof subfamily protein (haloacid dehalogenase superfamily)
LARRWAQVTRGSLPIDPTLCFRQSDRVAVRMVVLDIDGTLLNSKGTITEPTYQALGDLNDRGILLCLATARSGRIVFKPNEVPWDHAFLKKRGIYYNGATVFDRPARFYEHLPLPAEIVDSIVSFMETRAPLLQIALQHDDVYHSFRHEMSVDELRPWGFLKDELQPFETARRRPATKIMIYGGRDFLRIQEELVHLHAELAEAFTDSAHCLLADSRRAIYVMSRHASKGLAVRRLADLNRISTNEIAVFGDDSPDVEMFGQFGHSIAMGNAIDKLKGLASYVTLSNDQDGVVHALREYLHLG